jgi:hypothetical protein
MADTDPQLPDMADEGISTLAAQLTRRQIDRIIEKIKAVRASGKSEQAIEAAMTKDLPDYDAHTLGRLRQMATGGEIADDFAPESISASKQPKPNTVEITFATPPAGLKLHSLVRHQSKNWLVVAADGKTWTLKFVE